MSAAVFYLFLGFTAFSTLLQLLLSLRQSRAVLLHRGRVPRDFKGVVSLEEHQKAADYALAKQRFSRWHILYETLLLLMFTLGGGLNLLAETANRLATKACYWWCCFRWLAACCPCPSRSTAASGWKPHSASTT